MKNPTKSILLAAVFGLSGPAFAQKIDNPTYQNWAKFKVGSFSTLKSTSVAAGFATEMEMTSTLVELTADKAVVETKTTMSVAGQKIDQPAAKIEHPAKVDKPPGTASQPSKELAKGDEAMDVKGTKIKTRWVKMEMASTAGKTASTTWTSDDVPGQVVKMTSKTEGATASETTMTLVDFKADKK